MRRFRISERELSLGSHEIRIEGEFDFAVADELQRAFERCSFWPHLQIDLADCEFMDSAGVELLADLRRQSLGAGRALDIHGARGQVLRLLTLTGVVVSGGSEQVRAGRSLAVKADGG